MNIKLFYQRFRYTISACVGMGLLYLIRGSYLPYFFPIYEKFTQLSYAQISLLLTFFVIIQAITSPVIGLMIDKAASRFFVFASVMLFILGFSVLFFHPSFILCFVSVLFLGSALISLKNLFSVIVIRESKTAYLRKAVSIRTTFMNVGSFVGNLVGLAIIAHYGESTHILFLMVMTILLGAIGFFAMPKHDVFEQESLQKVRTITTKEIWNNRYFLSEAIIFFAVVISDGCWGTIIPKYLIDLYHSNNPIPIIYGVSLCTVVLGSYSINSLLSFLSAKMGFRLEWYKWLALILFTLGLLLLSFSYHMMVLIGAVILFILGEVIVVPCYDEIANKFTKDNGGTGSYFGALGLFDGLARVVGASIGLGIYGIIRHTALLPWFWVIVVSIFLGIVMLLYTISSVLATVRQKHVRN